MTVAAIAVNFCGITFILLRTGERMMFVIVMAKMLHSLPFFMLRIAYYRCP